MLGFVLAFALKYPRLAAFLRKFAPKIIVALAIAAAIGMAVAWHNSQVSSAFNEGFQKAEVQYAVKVSEANERAASMSIALRDMASTLSARTSNRERDLDNKIRDIKERVIYEISNNPGYNDCAVSDGMFSELQAQRAAVNTSITASNPGKP